MKKWNKIDTQTINVKGYGIGQIVGFVGYNRDKMLTRVQFDTGVVDFAPSKLKKLTISTDTGAKYLKEVYGLELSDVGLTDDTSIEEIEQIARKYDLSKTISLDKAKIVLSTLGVKI